MRAFASLQGGEGAVETQTATEGPNAPQPTQQELMDQLLAESDQAEAAYQAALAIVGQAHQALRADEQGYLQPGASATQQAEAQALGQQAQAIGQAAQQQANAAQQAQANVQATAPSHGFVPGGATSGPGPSTPVDPLEAKINQLAARMAGAMSALGTIVDRLGKAANSSRQWERDNLHYG